jgi:phage tail sheath protein FI
MSGAATAAGITLQEINVSQLTGGVATTIGALVGGYKRGPVGPNLVTSGNQWSTQYGPMDTTWGYFGVSGQAFLSNANQLWANRVIDGSTCCYASADVFNGSNPLGNNNYTYSLPAPNLNLSYSNANVASNNELLTYTFYLNAPLASGAIVNWSANVPNASGSAALPLTVAPVTYSGSSDATMVATANALATALNNAGVPATVSAINATNSNTCTTIQILVNYSVANAQYVSFVASITNSSSYLAQQKTDLFQVYAKDPGSFGNSIGFNITNANTASPPQISLLITYSTLSDGMSISGSINYNGNIEVISASGSSASAAAQALINKVSTVFGGISTGVYSVSPSGNLLSILLYAPAYGNKWTVGNTAFTATDTTTSTVLAITTGNNANSTYNYFTLNVYLAGSTTPVETFQVSLAQQTDGFGYQQFIEQVVNVGTRGSPSNYIRVVYANSGGTTNSAGNVSTSYLTGNVTSNSSPITFLGGGQDGVQPTDAEIVAGWQQFLSTDAYKIDILINGGYTDVVVQQEMVYLASTRQDCFAILDMPPNLQATTAATTYVGTTLGVNSSYAAIYTPDLQVLDTANNQLIYVPPSGYIASQYAYTDQNYAVWFSAAGPVRGVLNNVVGLYITYSPGDRQAMAPYNINTIKAARNGSGNVIWDVLTLSTPMSLLSYVSIRRTFLYLEQSIIQACQTYLFDNITSQTEFLITQSINNFLQPILNQQGISNFYVLCNSINNTAASIDSGTLNITVYIVPVVPARVIALKTVVTPNSISFQELISNGIF